MTKCVKEVQKFRTYIQSTSPNISILEMQDKYFYDSKFGPIIKVINQSNYKILMIKAYSKNTDYIWKKYFCILQLSTILKLMVSSQKGLSYEFLIDSASKEALLKKLKPISYTQKYFHENLYVNSKYEKVLGKNAS